MSEKQEDPEAFGNCQAVHDRVQKILGPTFDRLANYLLTGLDETEAREELVEMVEVITNIVPRRGAGEITAEDLQRCMELNQRILMTRRLLRENALDSGERNSNRQNGSGPKALG